MCHFWSLLLWIIESCSVTITAFAEVSKTGIDWVVMLRTIGTTFFWWIGFEWVKVWKTYVIIINSYKSLHLFQNIMWFVSCHPLWTEDVVNHEREKFLFKCLIICLQKTWFFNFFRVTKLISSNEWGSHWQYWPLRRVHERNTDLDEMLHTWPSGPLSCVLGLNVDVQSACDEIQFRMVHFMQRFNPFVLWYVYFIIGQEFGWKNKTRTFSPDSFI